MDKKTDRIEDLRDLLFTTINRLLDKDDPMDTAQAKSIANIGRVLVDSAKVEVDFMKTFGGGISGSGFIPINRRLGESKEPQQTFAASN
jgi:hypothetical protein